MDCIHHLIEVHALRTPDAPAILAPERPPLSYGGLWAQIVGIVRALNALGIGREDRVAVVLPNGPEMAAAFLAVAAGATVAPLNPALRAEEFDFHLSDLKARALIVQADVDSPATAVARARGLEIIELLPIPGAEAGLFTLAGRGARCPAQGGFAQGDDLALLLHTSGATSRPKLVPLTQANLCAAVDNSVTRGLSPEDRCINVLPLFHVQGLVTNVLTSLAAGSSIVCMPGFQAPRFFDWLDHFRPTWYMAGPTIHKAILTQAARSREVIARCPLRYIRSGSAPLALQTITDLESTLHTIVIESYGLTETSGRAMSNPLPPGLRKLGSVGLSLGPEVGIMDEAGSMLPRGRVGEIAMRGANVTTAYEDNPEANAASFVNDWLRTGDLGYLDQDGYRFVTGRLKEIINRGGEKISPREVDEVFMRHPAVAEAAAFAVPDDLLGEDVAVAVVLREGASASVSELRAFTASRLADHKVPRRVAIVDEVPKSSTGKVQRIGLAERLGLTPEVPIRSPDEALYVAPRGPIEEMLAVVWGQVLGLERVGTHDDFLQLGGDSVLAALIVARVRQVAGVQVPAWRLFETPTIAEQALVIIECLAERVDHASADGALSEPDGPDGMGQGKTL